MKMIKLKYPQKASLSYIFILLFFFWSVSSFYGFNQNSDIHSNYSFQANFSAPNAQTELFGVISEDLHLDLAGSPYNITGNVLIKANVILSIEPGVKMFFNDSDSYMKINGEVRSVGTQNQPIIIEKGKIWLEMSSSNNIFDYTHFTNNSNLDVDDSYVFINNSYFSDSLKVDQIPSKTCYILNSNISRLSFNEMYSSSLCKIRNNHIYNLITSDLNEYHGRLFFSQNRFYNPHFILRCAENGGATYFHHNEFIFTESGNFKPGDLDVYDIRLQGPGYIEFSYNNFTGMNKSLKIISDNCLITRNNFINCSFVCSTRTDHNFDISENWWGTLDNSVINEKIWDYYDDFELKKLIYEPIFKYPIIDSDMDKLENNEEISNYSTDPYSSDTDMDGYSDLWEISKKTNPNNRSDPLPIISYPKDQIFTMDPGSFIRTSINWHVTDPDVNRTRYDIFLNDTKIDTGTWKSGDTIRISVKLENFGEFIYRIELSDGNGGTRFDVVTFVVTQEDQKSTDNPFNNIDEIIPGYPLLIITLSLSIGILLILTYYKKKCVRPLKPRARFSSLKG